MREANQRLVWQRISSRLRICYSRIPTTGKHIKIIVPKRNLQALRPIISFPGSIQSIARRLYSPLRIKLSKQCTTRKRSKISMNLRRMSRVPCKASGIPMEIWWQRTPFTSRMRAEGWRTRWLLRRDRKLWNLQDGLMKNWVNLGWRSLFLFWIYLSISRLSWTTHWVRSLILFREDANKKDKYFP